MPERAIVEKTSKLAVPLNGLQLAENVQFLPGGDGNVKVQCRNGREERGTVDSGNTIVGFHRCYFPSKATKRATLAAVDDGATVEFFHSTGSSDTFAQPSGAPSWTSGTTVHMVTFPATDEVYVFNGTDAPYMYDPNAGTQMTAWTPTTSPSFVPNGRAATVWNNRLWVTHDNVAYATNIGDPTIITNTESLTFDAEVGGTILNLIGNGDVFAAILDTGVWRFTGDVSASSIPASDLVFFSDTGGVGVQSVIRTEHGFLYGAKDGVYISDGLSRGPNIAAAIMELWPDTGFTDMVVRWDTNEQQVRVRLRPTDSYIWVGTRVDLTQGIKAATAPVLRSATSLSPSQFFTAPLGSKNIVWGWSKHLNTPLAEGAAYQGADDDKRFVSCDADGKIWDQNIGTQDDDTNVIGKVKLALIPMSDDYQEMGMVDIVRITGKGSQSFPVSIQYDDQDDDIDLSVGQAGGDSERIIDGWARNHDVAKKGQRANITVILPQEGQEAELHAVLIETLAQRGEWRQMGVDYAATE